MGTAALVFVVCVVIGVVVCLVDVMRELARLRVRVHDLERRLEVPTLAPVAAPSSAPVSDRGAAPPPDVAGAAAAPAPASALGAAATVRCAVVRPGEATEASGAPDDGIEARIGKRWITWVGAVALLLATGLYLDLAGGRIGPAWKVGLAIAVGLAAIGAGDRWVRRDVRSLGQGLVGAGLGIVYAAVFAGFGHYGLYSSTTAALGLVFATAGGMTIAVARRAPPIAVLAVIGGFLTPVLVSTGGGDREVLCAYLAILDLGVLGVALVRRWRALDVIAFVGTWGLYAGWYARAAAPAPAPTLAWAAIFFALFLLVPLAWHLRRRVALRGDRLVLTLANAAVAFGFAAAILDGGRAQLAPVALVMATAYAVLAAVTRRRLPGDQRGTLALVALAVGFATLTVPLQLRAYGLTLAWAVEAPVLLALGARYRYYPLRLAGLVVLLLAAVRVLTAHWPLHTGAFTPVVNAELWSALLVPAAAGVHGWLARRTVARLGDARDLAAARLATVLAVVLALVLGHGEVAAAVALRDPTAPTAPATLVWWMIATLGFTAAAIATGRRAVWLAAVATAVVAGVLAAIAFDAMPVAGALFVNARFGAAAATIATWLVVWRGQRRLAPPSGWQATVAANLAAAAVVGAWAAISLEVWQHAHAGGRPIEQARWVAQMGLSIAWCGCAAAAIAIGFATRRALLRLAGLALFGLTAGKLVVVDLASVEQIYRVLSFFVLGLVLIAVSWMYHRRGGARPG